MSNTMVCMPRAWAIRSVKDFVLRAPEDDKIWSAIQNLLKEPGDLVNPEVVAWLYPDGETLGRRDMPEETVATMSDPTFVGNVEKLIRLTDFHRLQAEMQQLRVQLEAESRGADLVAMDVMRLQRQNTELRTCMASLKESVLRILPDSPELTAI